MTVASPQSPGERGIALLIALLMAVLVGALAAVVVTLTTTETLIGESHRVAHETAYAAEAGLNRAIHDLADVTDWSAVLSLPPGVAATFSDGLTQPSAPDGRTLDLTALTVERQRESDSRDSFVRAADRPSWRLYAHSSLAAVLPARIVAPPAYLLIWIADDPDKDDDPAADANGRIVIRAEAYGARGARRGIEAVIRRYAPGVVQVLTQREVR